MDNPVLKAVTEIAHSLVGGDRRGDYGHPLDDFCRTAVMWSALAKVRLTFVHVAQFMIALKQSREVNKQKQDNMIDACGYAECLDMCYIERDRRIKEGWTFDEMTGAWLKPIVVQTQTLEDLLKSLPSQIYPAPCTPPFKPYEFQKLPYIGDPLPSQTGVVICKNEAKPC